MNEEYTDTGTLLMVRAGAQAVAKLKGFSCVAE